MADVATTQPGAASKATPDLNDPNTRLSRADAMKAMSARRRETVQEEMTPEDAKAFAASAPPPAPPAATDEDSEPPEPDVKATLAEIEQRAQATEEPTLDPAKQVAVQTLADDDLAKYKVKVRINGVEQEMTLEQVRAEAQKTGAADQYLRQASEVLAEVKALKAAQAPESPTAPAGKKDDPSVAQAVEDFTTRMFAGDEVGAKQALTEALERLGQPQTTPALDVATLTRQVKYEYAIDEARSKFAAVRPAVLIENSLAQLVANQCIADELAARGAKSFYELPIAQVALAFDSAGKRMDGFAPGETKAKPEIDAARGTKKAAIDELPHATVRAAATAPAPLTPSEKIEQMRLARPGAVTPQAART